MNRTLRSVAGVLAVASVLIASCSDDDKGSVGTDAGQILDLSAKPVESGLPNDAKPTRGGQLVYALEATNLDFCLPSAQLAIAGIEMARSIYDPIVVPNGKGGYSPYLAESIEPNADYTVWTMKIRKGIKFHNGEVLNAEVMKNNIDAYRGKYPNRAALLLSFVFEDIEDVAVVDPYTLEFTMTKSWVAFPASLYASGRVSVMAQEQLDDDEAGCKTNLIGTGPFHLTSFDTNSGILKVQRNEDYWVDAPDGKPYPYVNAIEFVPMPNDDARIAALQNGDINVMHSSSSTDIAGSLSQLRNDGAINLVVSQERTETAYFMLNSENEPLDRLDARVAMAQALDRDKINKEANSGFATIANGPFAPGMPGHLDETGLPAYDPEAAKAAVAKLKEAGLNTTLTLLTTTAPTTTRLAVLAKEMWEEAGFTVELEVELQLDMIGRAIAGEYDVMFFRNQPGEDPDVNRIWWYGGGITNFGNFNDPEINKALDVARTSTDEAARKEAYELVNRRMGSQVYNIYLYFQPWAIAMADSVHDAFGPKLPNGDEPSLRLATGHSLLGMWIEPGSVSTSG